MAGHELALGLGQVERQAVDLADHGDQVDDERREQRDGQQQLIDWLHENEVDTVVGTLGWDEAGRPNGAHLIQQYIDGEIKIVLPEDAAEAELVHPKPEW
ncbi:hypothetical protein [Georgenia sp. SUBG003]|uniref:hypothetical protein n=1 Tax=Georgenia sp. SUBG003 TaxID=1497974 RepID=UPI003AB463FF